jgi:hypothetical protein
MEKLILKLKKDHPDLLFSPGHSHCWSPEHGQISYTDSEKTHSIEGILHELGHARMGHKGYVSDVELLQKEVEAWQEGLKLAKLYGVPFDEEHIQDCLDTYRDWLYKRSMCPNCLSTGLQKDERHYHCLNCEQGWRVTASRFCRPYRRSKPKSTKKDQP